MLGCPRQLQNLRNADPHAAEDLTDDDLLQLRHPAMDAT